MSNPCVSCLSGASIQTLKSLVKNLHALPFFLKRDHSEYAGQRKLFNMKILFFNTFDFCILGFKFFGAKLDLVWYEFFKIPLAQLSKHFTLSTCSSPIDNRQI